MTYTGRSNSYHLPKNSNRKLNVSRSKQGKWTCLGFWLIVFLMVTPAVMIWYIYHIDILDMPHTIRFMKQITSKYSISATSKLEQTLPGESSTPVLVHPIVILLWYQTKCDKKRHLHTARWRCNRVSKSAIILECC